MVLELCSTCMVYGIHVPCDEVMSVVSVVVSRKVADIERCHRIRRAVFIDEQGVPADLEVDGRDLECTHFLAFVGDELRGCARMRVVDGVAKAERVAVLAPRRGLGIGRALMQRMEEEARARGLQQLKLSAQVQVVGFYERIGYTPYGERFIEAGIWHRWMKRQL